MLPRLVTKTNSFAVIPPTVHMYQVFGNWSTHESFLFIKTFIPKFSSVMCFDSLRFVYIPCVQFPAIHVHSST